MISDPFERFFNTDDDDDEDDVPQAVPQPIQQAPQQAAQQVASAAIQSEPANVAVDGVADNIDELNNVDGTGIESGAKDPQQAAQDQAATIDNNIDPVGNEAVVDDDEEGKRWNGGCCCRF